MKEAKKHKIELGKTYITYDNKELYISGRSVICHNSQFVYDIWFNNKFMSKLAESMIYKFIYGED